MTYSSNWWPGQTLRLASGEPWCREHQMLGDCPICPRDPRIRLGAVSIWFTRLADAIERGSGLMVASAACFFDRVGWALTRAAVVNADRWLSAVGSAIERALEDPIVKRFSLLELEDGPLVADVAAALDEDGATVRFRLLELDDD